MNKFPMSPVRKWYIYNLKGVFLLKWEKTKLILLIRGEHWPCAWDVHKGRFLQWLPLKELSKRWTWDSCWCKSWISEVWRSHGLLLAVLKLQDLFPFQRSEKCIKLKQKICIKPISYKWVTKYITTWSIKESKNKTFWGIIIVSTKKYIKREHK